MELQANHLLCDYFVTVGLSENHIHKEGKQEIDPEDAKTLTSLEILRGSEPLEGNHALIPFNG